MFQHHPDGQHTLISFETHTRYKLQALRHDMMQNHFSKRTNLYFHPTGSNLKLLETNRDILTISWEQATMNRPEETCFVWHCYYTSAALKLRSLRKWEFHSHKITDWGISCKVYSSSKAKLSVLTP